MTALDEQVAFRNCFAAGQPIHQFPVILEIVERNDLFFLRMSRRDCSRTDWTEPELRWSVEWVASTERPA